MTDYVHYSFTIRFFLRTTIFLIFPIYINGGKTTNEAKAVFVRAFFICETT
ncbi:hypothetical protein EAG21025_28950 [Enterobacter asburiae]